MSFRISPQKEDGQLLTIQEASARLNLTKPTLRFWEKELEGILVPFRTKGGQRRYSEENIFILEEVKRLKEKGMSLVDIRRNLLSRAESRQKQSDTQDIDLLANRLAEIVKSAIYRFFEKE